MRIMLEVIKRFTLPILVVTIILLGTLGGAHSQVQGPRYGGSLVMAQSNEPGSIFYYATGATEAGVIATNIFDGLVAYDVAFNPIPNLAGSWDRSADQLTWTFHLVRNATFHDGVPFTSADVKFTYDNLVQLSASGRAYFPITSGDLWITTPDNYTVVFNWKAPFIEAIKDMGVFAAPIAPKHLYQASCPATPCVLGDVRQNQWDFKPVGTGPFKFQDWVRGDHVTLVRNEKYFKAGLPYLDKLTIRFLPEANTLLAAMKSGEVDYDPDGFPISLVSQLNADPAFSPIPVRNTALGHTVRLRFNLDSPIFKDVRVRRAFSLAIDRQTIIDKAAFGYGKVSKSTFPDTPSLAKYRSSNVPYPTYDPAAAEKLLDDAGYKRGPDGVRFTLDRFTVTTGKPEAYGDPAQLIKDMLKKVGIEAKIVLADEDTVDKWVYVDRPRAFDIALFLSRSGPFPYFSAKAYVSSYIQRVILTNVGYNNSQIDKLYSQIRSMTDEDQQVQLYRQVDEILNRDLPELWIYDYEYAQPIRNTFQGHSFYDVFPESGPLTTVWWTQGSPMAATTATSSLAGSPAASQTWTAAAVVVLVVLVGAYFAYSKKKK